MIIIDDESDDSSTDRQVNRAINSNGLQRNRSMHEPSSPFTIDSVLRDDLENLIKEQQKRE